jgi:hypothetical protein
MKYVPKPNQSADLSSTRPPDIAVSDISVTRLIDDGLLALYREMKNILMLSAKGKLDAASSRDLRDTVKLLFELKDRESESLRGLTDEQLQAKVKEALDDNE